jgi:hypothetical protein
MSTPEEATLKVSFLKALLLSIVCFSFFAAAIFSMGLPLDDPLLVAVLVFMFTSMPIVFAVCMCLMLRCKIGRDGLRPAVPTFYQRVLRWEDVAGVYTMPVGLFHVIVGRDLGAFCVLPRRFFLKRPQSLKQLIEQYAPADNIVRRRLAA